MRKFTKEIAALIASAAVSAAVGTSTASSEEIVLSAGVDTAPDEIISSLPDEDMPIQGFMMPEPTTLPPLGGVPLPPDDYIEETTEEMPPLAGDMVLADGDINGDGEFNVADVVMLQNYLVGKSQNERMTLGNADMNGDGKVNVFDLVMMKRRLLDSVPTAPPAPVAPPLVQPVHFKNTAELIREIKKYDLDKYPEYSREGYRKMYDTIKNNGSIYEVMADDLIDIDTDHGIAVVPCMQYEDLGIYYYTKSGYQVIVYYADAGIEADGTADYFKRRFNQNILKEISVNGQNVSITGFGTAENKDSYRMCASAFIDDNHYYTVRTNAGGTEEELIDFLDNMTFIKSPVE